MSTPTKEQVLEALKRIKGPDLKGNIVDLGLVSQVLIKDGRVYFAITVPKERAAELEPLRQAAEKVVGELAGVTGVSAVLTNEAPPRQAAAPPSAPQQAQAAAREHARVQEARQRGTAGDGTGRRPGPQAPQSQGVPGVKHIIAVASGKGGVGKSTTSVNLALGFQAIGLRVGILDADIYGPSMPRLLGLTGRPQTGEGNKLKPMQAYGLKVMSMGFLVDEGVPVVWRGPMVMSALTQMLREVTWDELDVMVVDMPPGTGDAQITLAQQTPLSGAIIVSTPQDLALIDARKGLAMFRQVNVPLLGIVENMSYFVCPKCGERSDIFAHGGARFEADKLGVPFLGEVPLHMDIRLKSDAGQPIVVSQPNSEHAKTYREIAAKAWEELESGQGTQRPAPRIVIE
jgi:ATP-binding protein involved in chromosome partitioning